MLIEQAKQRLAASFRATRYRFMPSPAPVLPGTYGVYVHVPFCYARCAYCPFYTEPYRRELAERYVRALVADIANSPFPRPPEWVYIGGGTPNTLDIPQMVRIIGALRAKTSPRSVGVELLPRTLTGAYLEGLADAGVTKISLGVESFSDEVLQAAGRKNRGIGELATLLAQAKRRGLWVNVDVMVGLPRQTARMLAEDIGTIAALGTVDQITMYPVMSIGRLGVVSSMSSRQQFECIEAAADTLARHGYSRTNVWTYARGEDLYDSSRDELVQDYLGFGAGAFSTWGAWKVVNPELPVYLHDRESGTVPRCLAAPNTPQSVQWRVFARMVYDLRCSPRGLAVPQKLVCGMLGIFGYVQGGRMTAKGRWFSHEITKHVVEKLPYPLQNPDAVDDWAVYAAERDRLRKALNGDEALSR